MIPASIAKTKVLLEEDPALFDDAYAAEVMADAPRQGILDLLTKIEKAKGSEAREKILKILEVTKGS